MTRLEDVCSAIVDCEHKSAPIDERGGYFAVGTPAMRRGEIDYSEARRINRGTFDLWTRRLQPRWKDILLAREAPVGPVVAVPKEENVAPGQRTVLLRPAPDRVDPTFLLYLLRAPATQAALGEKASGSTVAHLNVSDIRAFDLGLLPALPEQRAIAEVLGALDDKIAANQKVADMADALAVSLFGKAVREVEFGPMVFADVAQVGGGGTPSTKISEYWDGPVAWAAPTDVTRLPGPYLFETARTLTPAGLASCASPVYPEGAVLMTSRATIGAFALPQSPVAVNQGFIVVVAPDADTQMWLFHEMRSRVAEFLNHANGATFLELSRGRFRHLPVRFPDRARRAEFGSRASALHAAAAGALAANSRVAALRDALLPALMSGRLRVRDAEKVVSDAV